MKSIANILLEEELSPLPMDDESRMSRAKQMGFDTSTVYYHGSPDSRGIHNSGFKPAGHRNTPALFFTPEYRIANTYADDTRAFDYQNSEPEVLSVFLRFNNPTTINWKGRNFRGVDANGTSFNVGDFIAEAHSKGHDAVIVRNIADEYGGNGKSYHGKAGTIVVVFSASQVRSVKAKFDPAKSNSSEILETDYN